MRFTDTDEATLKSYPTPRLVASAGLRPKEGGGLGLRAHTITSALEGVLRTDQPRLPEVSIDGRRNDRKRFHCQLGPKNSALRG